MFRLSTQVYIIISHLIYAYNNMDSALGLIAKKDASASLLLIL